MEAGNPKQAAILGVVAVGAIGFLFTQLGGKGSPLAAVVAAATQQKAAPVKVAALALSRDPFSHVKLAPLVKKTETAEKPSSEKGTGYVPKVLVGELPDATVGPVVPKVSDEIDAEAKGEPKAKPAPPAKTTLSLEAVVGAPDTVAFLCVGGAESQPFHPNDRIKGAIRLLRVEDGAVVISAPKGARTLNVGDRIDL